MASKECLKRLKVIAARRKRPARAGETQFLELGGHDSSLSSRRRPSFQLEARPPQPEPTARAWGLHPPSHLVGSGISVV
ncbi:UNVERIFIED_CONTAM: hypothetical protein Sradi_5253100 [Sesamum radiatum]|uniref:Uncharacterized protein n=1 Tax=Sesamum radiatum TaxID=300843 RepID=A0AAW2LQC4_SESRA